MEPVTLKLTGVLTGSEETGYTAYFRQFPNVSADGGSVAEARQNLLFSLSAMIEFLEEEEVLPAEGKDFQTFHEEFQVA